MRNWRNTNILIVDYLLIKYKSLRSRWRKLSSQRINRLSTLYCRTDLNVFISKDLILNKYVDQKVFEARVASWLLWRTNRFLTHSIKQDFSMNLRWKRISMINWTRRWSTYGSSLIVFWTWRREARTSKSSSVDWVDVNLYYDILIIK